MFIEQPLVFPGLIFRDRTCRKKVVYIEARRKNMHKLRLWELKIRKKEERKIGRKKRKQIEYQKTKGEK